MISGIDTSAHRLLDALLNGAYQGMVLTALVAVGLRLFPRTNAATRHAVSLATLILVAVLPVVHLLHPTDRLRADRESPTPFATSPRTDTWIRDDAPLAAAANPVNEAILLSAHDWEPAARDELSWPDAVRTEGGMDPVVVMGQAGRSAPLGWESTDLEPVSPEALLPILQIPAAAAPPPSIEGAVGSGLAKARRFFSA